MIKAAENCKSTKEENVILIKVQNLWLYKNIIFKVDY